MYIKYIFLLPGHIYKSKEKKKYTKEETNDDIDLYRDVYRSDVSILNRIVRTIHCGHFVPAYTFFFTRVNFGSFGNY